MSMCGSNMKSSESAEIINGECDVSTSVKEGEASGSAKFSAGLRRIPFNEACFFFPFFFFVFNIPSVKIFAISLEN